MSATFISPILCLSHTPQRLLADPKLQRTEFAFPVIYTKDNLAITEFPITLFSKNINHVQRGLFLDMKNGIIRNGVPKFSHIDSQNRMQLGHRERAFEFSLIESEHEEKRFEGEIVGIGTKLQLLDESETSMFDRQVHYFDQELFEQDEIFAKSWICPQNHYVEKLVLYRKNNQLVALQLIATKFKPERPSPSTSTMTNSTTIVSESTEESDLFAFLLILLGFGAIVFIISALF